MQLTINYIIKGEVSLIESFIYCFVVSYKIQTKILLVISSFLPAGG